MRKVGIFFVIACVALLAACSNPFRPGSGGDGTITIAFAGGDRAVMLAAADLDSGYVVDTHIITLTGPGGERRSYNLTGLNTMSIPVRPGAWTVSVRSMSYSRSYYDRDYIFSTENHKALRAFGTSTVGVRAGETAAARITMYRAADAATHAQLSHAMSNVGNRETKIIVLRNQDNNEIEIKDSIHFEAYGRNIFLVPYDGMDVTISRGERFEGTIFDVSAGTLTLGKPGMSGSITIDGGHDREIDAYGPIISVVSNTAALVMHPYVTLTGNNRGSNEGSNGGAVEIISGSFTMYGGSITDNTVHAGGGGVFLLDGTFRMIGGRIYRNTARLGGGLRQNDGTFTMTGGVIYGADDAFYANISTPPGSDAAFIQNEPESNTIRTWPHGEGGGNEGDGSERNPFRVRGATFVEQLEWLYYNAQSGHFYLVEINGNAQIGPRAALVSDVTGVTITMRGNEHEIVLASNGSLFTVGYGVTLVLEDVILRGREENNAPLVNVDKDGTLVMNAGATITGNSNTSPADQWESLGGGVRVAGTFIMNNDGLISGNTSINAGGGGVLVDGTFNMNGGDISGNRAEAWGGGGVFIGGGATFNMNSGARIHGNTTVSAGGGGVLAGGGAFFNMYGGEISHNTAAGGGGGVSVGVFDTDFGVFTMTGGAIFGNTAGGSGGGVFVARDDVFAVFTMAGGTINNNTASSTHGGGVYVDGYFNMTGTNPAIVNNTALDGGGVYLGRGTFTMFTGTISGDNEATRGGGVFVGNDGTFIMSGGEVSGNIAPEGGASIFVEGDGTAEYYGALTATYGVYMFTTDLPLPVRFGTAENPIQVAQAAGDRLHYQLDWLRQNAANDRYYLVEISDSWELPSTSTFVPDYVTGVTITLRGTDEGADILFEGNGSLFTVGPGLTLVLDGNLTLEGTHSNNFSLIRVLNGGNLVMNQGVTLTGNRANNIAYSGGAVTVLAGGRFTMNDGEISGNTAILNGGGVFVSGGVFTMHGGYISGNTANQGGGVQIAGAGRFDMHGGTIYDNEATGTELAEGGGGVHTSGSQGFRMYGGRITGNTAHDGGGVNHRGNWIDIRGDAEISGNNAIGNGGGIATGDHAFTMSGTARIFGNNAGGLGGGLFRQGEAGNFAMSGGTIYGSDAPDGIGAPPETRISNTAGSGGHAVHWGLNNIHDTTVRGPWPATP